MATLYIAELSGTRASGMQVAMTPPLVEQTVAIAGASAQSAAFDNATVVVRIHADAVCSIAFGTNPTATTAKMRLAADSTEYFAVKGGQKVAVITNT
jgi:hypothetical protein